ncbi:hypothetical protein [Alkalibacillus salilacus]|uniref:N-acetyltransferase domain-containing protein n=1 Tax=Alkalibacillus salilacus TaxID=284582 RepID=A0ABT9VBA2_9BACI|nr:hypothetical protein [Alkalibacillus salilacus]MDQ0158223.1 hypothetical protein [Alkalibacillus salilacus]
MGPLNIRPAGPNDFNTIDDIIHINANDSSRKNGYPFLNNVKDLEKAIESYQNHFHHCAMMIYLNKDSIGFTGLLYEEGDYEAWVVGPYLNNLYYSTTLIQIVLEELLHISHNSFTSIYLHVPTENEALMQAAKWLNMDVLEQKEHYFTFVASLNNTLTL